MSLPIWLGIACIIGLLQFMAEKYQAENGTVDYTSFLLELPIELAGRAGKWVIIVWVTKWLWENLP